MTFRVEAPTRISWLAGIVGIVLLGVASSYLTFWWLSKRKPRTITPHPIDTIAIFRENNRGIGYMERFNYAKALESFERVNQMDPAWLPGKINLGIALLNIDDEQNRTRAIELFQDMLLQDSENPYAHFCLGMLLNYRGLSDEAAAHFEAVTRIDPNDAHSWFELAKLLPAPSPQRAECLEKALRLDPYLNGARFALAQELSQTDPKRKDELLKEFTALRDADWENVAKVRYTEMGPYADVIGRDLENPAAVQVEPPPQFSLNDNFKVRLAPGVKWASREDLRKSPQGELLAAVRDRFGGTMVELDYNRDGKPDLFLLGAVVEKGQVRDLLLRNDGDSVFTDVTAEAGLAAPRPSLGCCVGDFDNNEFPDLFITGVGRQWLLRNDGKGGFEDVTAAAGLDKLTGVCLGSAFADIDQDGDLDLLVAQYAATPEEALAALQGKSGGASKGGLAVFINIGEAPAVRPTQDPLPCQPKFRRLDAPADLLGPAAPFVGLALSDLDDDHDLDLFVLADGQAPAMILNDRLLRFHREPVPATFVPPGQWNGALVLDVNQDARSDLFILGPGRPPVLLISKPFEGKKDVRRGYTVGPTNSPPLLQAQAIDLDYDGRTDIVGLSERHIPVFLQNDGGRLVHDPDALGSDLGWPKDLIAIHAGRFGSGKFLDFVTWSEGKGLQFYINQGNGNSAVKLQVTGHRRVDPRGEKSRCNADGFGIWATAQAENFYTRLEYTTLSAGLGQSRQPIILGLGRRSQPDVVRLRWPDNVIQAELDIPACQLIQIQQINNKDTSCPILFTWNGERFVFITDFLGAGSMGELQPDGSTRPPRPEESVKIEAEQLVPRDGKYILKIAEPMNEATYLDRLQLLVLDHPADVRVYPDERFTSETPNSKSEIRKSKSADRRTEFIPFQTNMERNEFRSTVPSQDLLAFREEIFPVKARDHRGKDVTQTLAKWDRQTVDDFAQRSWLGYAEEHWVELDFGNRLAKFKPEDQLILCLAGWTDYPYPESIWAATQAGIPLLPPTLERLDGKGQWQTLVADAGFPAGLPRMMTLPLPPLAPGGRGQGEGEDSHCVLRLRTNMEVYWDQIFVAPVLKANTFKVSSHEVAKAVLSPCGLMQEFSPDGRLPTIYDYDRQQTVAVSRLAGKMTRYGEVTELLHDRDDRFVIFGPGDELTVEFDAKNLPPLPPGWKRSFVLKTWGYCKDCSLWTATGDTIEPLPFQKMSKYPYGPLTSSPLLPGGEGGVRGSGPEEHYPDDPLHQDYLRRYQTRQVGRNASTSR